MRSLIARLTPGEREVFRNPTKTNIQEEATDLFAGITPKKCLSTLKLKYTAVRCTSASTIAPRGKPSRPTFHLSLRSQRQSLGRPPAKGEQQHEESDDVGHRHETSETKPAAQRTPAPRSRRALVKNPRKVLSLLEFARRFH